MASTSFKQFRRFSTDAYGLERLLRFIQAFLHIIVALTATQQTFISSLAGIPFDHELFRGFAELRGLLGLVRRFLRFFRFFDAFANSYVIFIGIMNSGDKDAGPNFFLLQTLDALAGTFNGMYLLLEALTLPDALKMPGLAILGREMEHYFKIESQRSWFIALLCGALACLIRINNVRSHPIKEESAQKDVKQNGNPEKVPSKNIKFTDKRREDALAKQAQASGQIHQLTRKMVASLLDLALPGSVIGWIPAPSVVVGVIMLITSYLTGLDVWERCGKEIVKA